MSSSSESSSTFSPSSSSQVIVPAPPSILCLLSRFSVLLDNGLLCSDPLGITLLCSDSLLEFLGLVGLVGILEVSDLSFEVLLVLVLPNHCPVSSRLLPTCSILLLASLNFLNYFLDFSGLLFDMSIALRGGGVGGSTTSSEKLLFKGELSFELLFEVDS